jgi:hypothetical protein
MVRAVKGMIRPNRARLLRDHRPAGQKADPTRPVVATGEDGRRALELANSMLLSSFRDQTVPIPVDRAAYDSLLAELKQKAERGEFRKRERVGEKEEILAVLPEGT